MSELFDEESDETTPPPRRGSRRSRALVITLVILVAAFFALTTFSSFYTDRLWYQSVGYGSVFTKLLWTRIGLFIAFGAVMAVVLALNVYLAYRFRPLFRIPTGPATSLDRYRDVITPIRTWLLISVAVVVGIFAGASGLGQWRTFLLWQNRQPFGQNDAYFGKDVGFFVFSLPWYHYLVDFAMTAAVVGLIAAALTHYLYGGIRLQVPEDRLSGAAQVQISALAGVFVLFKAVDYYLDRFDLVTDQNSLFTGMNYTADNALQPARNILLGVALICAVLFFLNIWRRTWQLPTLGLALLALSSVLLGMIWPAIVQNFQVNPSERTKEEPYIAANIAATRDAYGLDTSETENYEATPSGNEQLPALQSQTTQIPVIDPNRVSQTFEQLQQARAYYSVSSPLDVDRYNIDGEEQPLVLGVRELDQSGIEASDQNWSNLHTVYTHGEGIIAAYADQASGGTGAGSDDSSSDSSDDDRISWAEGIEPGQDALGSSVGDFEDRIYFGERSPDYSIVGKASPDDPSVELGLASGNADEDQTTTYDGSGGISIGSTFNQLMYALKFGEPNFLLSGQVNDNSQLLYDRVPRDRVEKVAPWLTVDGDAYPAIVDGRIQWILDGYTTTDRYPNSQRESFDTMIDDSLQQDSGLQTVPTDEINYMRSAVKVTVDAYDGTVNIYEWDEDDPILQAWEGAFPGTVKPKSDISEDLMDHLRYPEDLFKVQRYQLARYHVTDAGDFYTGNNRWAVPEDPDPNLTTASQQPPYRLFANQDGTADGTPTWALTSTFVPRDKGNLAAFVSVDSDATSDDFGIMKILQVSESDIQGPGQIANEMTNDTEVRDKLLPFTNGDTPPIYGNLVTVPVGDGLIYVEPVYAAKSGSSSYPILQYVITSYNGDVGIGRNLTEALKDSFGTSGGTITPPDTGGGGGGDGGNGGNGGENPPDNVPVQQQINDLLDQAAAAFDAADAAQRDNDTVEYARQIEKAKALISQAAALADGTGSGSTDSSN